MLASRDAVGWAQKDRLLPQAGDPFANARAVTRAAIGRALIGPRADGALGSALAELRDDLAVMDAADAVARETASAPGPAQVARELIVRATHGRSRRPA